MLKSCFYCFCAILTFTACTSLKNYDNGLDYALASERKAIREIQSKATTHELQIRYVQIDLEEEGGVQFKNIDFQLEPEQYFYPASTVKLPIVILSLEKLNRLGISYKTPFKLANDTITTSFEDTVKQIFAVSDNLAYNRLYEFLGADYINSRMHQLGIHKFRISHRLSTDNAMRLEHSPLIINPKKQNESLISVPKDTKAVKLELKGITKGIGFQLGEATHYTPFDFSLKNYYPIDSQWEVFKRIFYSESIPEDQRFKLSEQQRNFLIESMAMYPRDAGYDPKTYPDNYGKFVVYGSRKGKLPRAIKIYNKVGYAYGTLTDAAYITHEKKNIAFMLFATVLVNENKIFNDNQYQYDSLGIPFLAALGKAIYKYEKHRN